MPVDTDVKMIDAGEEEGEADEGRTDRHDDDDHHRGGGEGGRQSRRHAQTDDPDVLNQWGLRQQVPFQHE